MLQYLSGQRSMQKLCFYKENLQIKHTSQNMWRISDGMTQDNRMHEYDGSQKAWVLVRRRLREAIKKHDILWHWVNFILHLPILPNYDIIYYDIAQWSSRVHFMNFFLQLNSSLVYLTVHDSARKEQIHICLVVCNFLSRPRGFLKNRHLCFESSHSIESSLRSLSNL